MVYKYFFLCHHALPFLPLLPLLELVLFPIPYPLAFPSFMVHVHYDGLGLCSCPVISLLLLYSILVYHSSRILNFKACEISKKALYSSHTFQSNRGTLSPVLTIRNRVPKLQAKKRTKKIFVIIPLKESSQKKHLKLSSLQ